MRELSLYFNLVEERTVFAVGIVKRLIYLLMYLCMSLKCYSKQFKLVNWEVLM